MARRLTNKEIKKIILYFTEGKSIDELSKIFSCTKLTISRNLKKNIDEKTYKELIIKTKSLKQNYCVDENNNSEVNQAMNKDIESLKIREEIKLNEIEFNYESVEDSTFIEIAPLNYEIDNTTQKDLTSIPISEVNFPKNVYVIVDNKIELVPKFLKDFPEWQFLSKDDLNRKTLKIYSDLKIAKRDCNNEQKVIKIPNPDIFKIVAPMLVSRGISRIVSVDKLIAL